MVPNQQAPRGPDKITCVRYRGLEYPSGGVRNKSPGAIPPGIFHLSAQPNGFASLPNEKCPHRNTCFVLRTGRTRTCQVRRFKMPELSIIDYLIWAVQRSLIQGEGRYFDGLKNKYETVINLYEEHEEQ